MNAPHIPVLLDSVLHYFSGINGILFDCTLGYAGHSSALLESNNNLKIIGCDQDNEAIKFSSLKLCQYNNRVDIRRGRYSEVFSNLNHSNFLQIRAILADIGVSSLQIDKDDRGFGLNSNALDMRMNNEEGLNATDVVNEFSKSELENIFEKYGELTNASLIASKIVKSRILKKITSASQLADIVGRHSLRGRKVSVATLVFQAIRIHVNDELGELERLLLSIEKYCRAGVINDCMVGIISFHSLEDKIVKETFKKWEKECICPEYAIRCECGKNNSIGSIINKKPIVASSEEIKLNPRSSSAKLRLFKIR